MKGHLNRTGGAMLAFASALWLGIQCGMGRDVGFWTMVPLFACFDFGLWWYAKWANK